MHHGVLLPPNANKEFLARRNSFVIITISQETISLNIQWSSVSDQSVSVFDQSVSVSGQFSITRCHSAKDLYARAVLNTVKNLSRPLLPV